jgi:DNA-binding transcriptional MocR family regulator
MVLPDGFSARVAKVAEDTYINPSYLNQALVYQFLQKGWIDSQLVYLKDLYRQRRDAMLAALSREMKYLADWNEPHGGFFIACYVKGPVDADVLMEMALENGIRLSDGRGFHLSGGEAFIRLPFCALTEEQITTGISRLAGTIKSLLRE